MYNEITKTIVMPDGQTIEISTGKLAKQADGSVVLKVGNTMLLATVVSAQDAKEDVDFLPLSCEYKEKFASVGRVPGGFLKREGRASDYEILISRLIDRALRPLFPEDYHAETFVNVMLMSSDKDIYPDAYAGLAASAAIAVSDIPFHGPISECRVARINGELVINPKQSELIDADIDLIVAGTIDNINMVEGEMSEVSEQDMLEAIKVAHDAIKLHCKVQLELAEAAGKTAKRVYCHETHDEALREKVHAETYEKVYAVARECNANKHLRKEKFDAVKEAFLSQYSEEELDVVKKLVDVYYHDVEKEAVRNMILDEGLRLDGRKTTQIRPIWCEVDYLPSTHGSAVFTRGETQSVTTCTLGSKLDEQRIDGAVIATTERFVLHYNFPPFSTGDARPSRGVSRREVGHGNLAHRALKRMIPGDSEGNPYSIRLVSDILESNGSSSMATVCAGCLSLMDAGVKLKSPVSGIAMGLISDSKTGKYAVLSDILGDEDHLGDMDFKVTGTSKGITATQMDIKVDGLSYEVLEKALLQAKEGRAHILGEMMKTLDAPREDYKPHAPRIERIIIPQDMIGAVIGPGGKIIQEIQKETSTIITIEEANNQGMVDISAPDKESIQKAINWIKGIVAIPEVNEIYDAKVKSIVEFGAFVEFLPGKEGLLHISEIEWHRLSKVSDVLKVGDKVKVKLLAVDKNGKFKLSRKALLPRPPKEENQADKQE
ncbi:MAG: polyribonucleotide nucleotidyltransferase [Bacteroidales bacterium]|nr:polyribonucleotide nucleotidyltransferase [Bacteroidales bacterium]